MISIKIGSVTCQDMFCYNRLLDAEVNESTISIITKKEGAVNVICRLLQATIQVD